MALPKERERVLSDTHTEVRFVMTENLKDKLKELRTLLGFKSINMSLAELVDYMAGVSIHELKVKKFGKKRVTGEVHKKLKSKTDTASIGLSGAAETPKSELQGSKNIRYVPQSIQHQIWMRDNGKCCKCGSQKNINMDHIKPVAFGGKSNPGNLRLLCFHCNQRQAIKVFGVDHIQSKQAKENHQLSFF